MKTINSVLFLSALLVLSAGCGKAAKHASKKINQKLEEKINKEVECVSTAVGAIITQSFEPDYDIKFHRATVDKVLEDLRINKDLTAENFWSKLSAPVRNALNFELNLYMINQRTTNTQAVYQSTAYFFTKVRDTFDEKIEYKVKDSKDKNFSFKLRGAKTTGTNFFNTKCGKQEKTDISGIVTTDVLKFEEIAEVYECRTTTKSLMLMEMKEQFYLMAGKDALYRLPVKDLHKKDKNRKLELTFDSREVSFEIELKKKREQTIKEWSGKRSEIELVAPEYAIDEQGACNTLLHAL